MNKLLLRSLIALSALGALALARPVSAAAAPAKPNIIYILADDLGWTDTATYGSKWYETPNIDKLATQGMKMMRYHNCQNCQPTRAAIMSGQYAPRTGIYTVGGIDRFDWQTRNLRPVDNVTVLPADKITVAQTLKKAGYATGMFGKWHLGEKKGEQPADRGFDEAIVSAGKHFNFKTDPETPHNKDDYLADWLTDRSVEFITKHKAEPFFLYLPHYGVHSPIDAKKDDEARFSKKPPVGGHNNPTYAGMIYAVDRSVGRIMALLDELKIADNTVLIFSSDNGGVGGYIREGVNTKDTTDNTPLRSGKGSLYEGGVRVPFVVRWPGQIKPGSTCDTPTIHVDVYPTLMEIAGAQAPANYTLDGTSMMPLFKDPTAAFKQEAIFQHFPGYLGAMPGKYRTTPVGTIQMGDWKLMEFFEDNHLELYNLKDDIGETNNLATKNPEKVQELKSKMLAWRSEVGAKMPAPHTPEKEPAKKKKKKGKDDSGC